MSSYLLLCSSFRRDTCSAVFQMVLGRWLKLVDVVGVECLGVGDPLHLIRGVVLIVRERVVSLAIWFDVRVRIFHWVNLFLVERMWSHVDSLMPNWIILVSSMVSMTSLHLHQAQVFVANRAIR
jgi:hypothetical protein